MAQIMNASGMDPQQPQSQISSSKKDTIIINPNKITMVSNPAILAETLGNDKKMKEKAKSMETQDQENKIQN